MRAAKTEKPDYGIDAPVLARNVVILVIVGTVVWAVLARSSSAAARLATNVISSLVETGVFAIVLSLVYVKITKFYHRDRMLTLIPWRGNEQVLDIGTGRGLLLIGAAKRLSTGTSFGVDLWRQGDLRGNSAGEAWHNAEREGVADRVVITSADAQYLPFADGAFDCILSNLCLHNIPTPEGRDRACREIARVLKPGGQAVLSDFQHSSQYAAILTEQGLEVTRSTSFLAAPFLLTMVRARKR